MAEKARRDELADFLRTRRARLTPAQVGLPSGLRRRTPGLRREEVALLADVGITWYTFLEQGRPIKVSAGTLARLARALRLPPLEVEHLFALADRPLANVATDEQVPAMVTTLLDAMGPMPAHIVNRRFDIVGWNRAASLVWLDPATLPETERNYLWLFFGTADIPRWLAEWEIHARHLLAQFRFNYGNNQDDPRFEAIIQRCRKASPDFRSWWVQHEVVHRQARQVHLDHPRAGPLCFEAGMFHPSASPALTVIVSIPLPGTRTREAVLSLMEEDADVAGDGTTSQEERRAS